MSAVQSAAGDVDVDLRRLFAGIGRHWLRIVVVCALVTMAALAAALFATPHYEAETRILIESRESVFTRPQGDNATDKPQFDEEGVTSQVEVIGSVDILKQVAAKLDLAKLREFDETADMSLGYRLMVLTGLKSDPSEVSSEERVIKVMREKLKIYRVEKSRVIVVNFNSEDPRLAAEIPNAIADAYIAVSRDAKLASNADATQWLEPEIASLTLKVKEAEGKVATFRAESDLPLGQNNSTLASQQLSELSSELSKVRAARSNAEVNADQVRHALAGGGSLDSFPEVVSSGLIQRLREKQVQLKADIADLSTTLLDNHPRIRALRSQLGDLDTQIRRAAQTILQGQVNEANAAAMRETQLTADLARLKVESSRVDEKEVELRALEREATAQRDLLESYLGRYREAASRRDGNYLPVDARVFSRAVQPLEPYFPKVLPIVGAAFAGSLLLMSIATMLGELFSGRAMRPADTNRPEPVLVVAMPEPVAMPQPVAMHKPASMAEPVAVPAPVAAPEPALKPQVPPAPAMGFGLGEVGIDDAVARLIKTGVSRAIFVSPEGDAGAACSVRVARATSDQGKRVLLLDLTESGAASDPMLDGEPLAGITNLLAGDSQFRDVIHADRYSSCHVIPNGTADAEKAMRAIERLPIVIESLTSAYDMLVIECGAAGAESLRRLVSGSSAVLLGFTQVGPELATIVEDFASEGFKDVILVTPGDEPPLPSDPALRRSAA